MDIKGTEWSMLLGMYCSVAHTEDEKISRKTKDGIHGTLLKGKCTNKAPRGYLNKRDDKGEAYVETDKRKQKLLNKCSKRWLKELRLPTASDAGFAPTFRKVHFIGCYDTSSIQGKSKLPLTRMTQSRLSKASTKPSLMQTRSARCKIFSVVSVKTSQN
jgi:hypothetical protein